MSHSLDGSKLPHTLRVIILLLRFALGLDFFYLGWSAIFSPPLERSLRAHSLEGLYSWMNSSGGMTWLHPIAPWAFMIIGGCLFLGLVTRIAAGTGIILVALSYLPSITYPSITVYEFLNDAVVIILCLLILVASNAGVYFGLDKFFHISFSKKAEKV